MNLYEIDQEIMLCVDSETGEVIDAERLENLMMARETKIESVACWIKNLKSDIVAFNAEISAFSERKKEAERKIESLENWLKNALQGQKFSTAKCAVSFRASEKIDVLDGSIIPKEFLTEKITYSPNKTEIKKAIKAGQEISGCQLVSCINTTIK